MGSPGPRRLRCSSPCKVAIATPGWKGGETRAACPEQQLAREPPPVSRGLTPTLLLLPALACSRACHTPMLLQEVSNDALPNFSQNLFL